MFDPTTSTDGTKAGQRCTLLDLQAESCILAVVRLEPFNVAAPRFITAPGSYLTRSR
jgi:hypothetical protein